MVRMYEFMYFLCGWMTQYTIYIAELVCLLIHWMSRDNAVTPRTVCVFFFSKSDRVQFVCMIRWQWLSPAQCLTPCTMLQSALWLPAVTLRDLAISPGSYL